MSRWKDQFEKHAIHETLSQTRDWAAVEFEEVDSELNTEQRRLLKFLTLIASTLEDMDHEIFPEADLNKLNTHMRDANFWNQLSSYAENGDSQHLRTANDHMNSQIPRIYQLAGLSKTPSSQKIIDSIEAAYDGFCESLEKSLERFKEKIDQGEAKLDELGQLNAANKQSFDSLSKDVETALGGWGNEHGEALNSRKNQFEKDQLDRKKEFDTAMREILTKSDARADKIFEDLDQAINNSKKHHQDQAEKVEGDMKVKHEAILQLHDLVAGDGVAGGYKKTAIDEGKAANLWRKIAMGSFIGAAIWTFIKVLVHWTGWTSTLPGKVDWLEVFAATSLTLILLGTAAYAARQSKLHRENEQQMSWFALEVNALDPFMSSLNEDQQNVLKMQLSQRLFGQNRTTVRTEDPTSEKDLLRTMLDAASKLAGPRE